MSILEQRAQVRRRLSHLEDLDDDNPRFNIRSMIGAGSVYDLLDYGTYQKLSSASAHLVGNNLRDGTTIEVGDQLRTTLREFPNPCGFLALSDSNHSMLSNLEAERDVAKGIFALPG